MEPETVTSHAITGLRIFTDGSKMESGVGAALTCWRDGEETLKKKFRLQSYCTVFQAELYAVLQATEVALKLKDNSVNIFSDSRSSLEMLKSTGSLHPLAFAIKRNLSLLKTKHKMVSFFWVRAHVGTAGNERADFLAREAVEKLKTRPNYDSCPISYIKRQLRKETVTKWSERYKSGETASVTKTFLPSAEMAHKLLNQIKVTPLLTQVFTGHGGFAEYLHKFKRKEDPGCVCEEGVAESILHMLMDCPQHSRIREDLHQQIQIELCRGSVTAIMEKKAEREIFLKYCCKIAQIAIKRNRTR